MTPSLSAPATIAIGENHPDLALTLALLIDLQDDLRCIGHSPTSSGLLTLAEREPADAYLVDLALDDGSSIPMIQSLRSRQPDCVIIAFTGLGNPTLAEQCERAGCNATLEKNGSVTQLLETLRGLLG
jgi:DNA-binding NarL/FixJ family response regulator